MDDDVIKARQTGFSIFAGIVFAADWWVLYRRQWHRCPLC
jgi:hypothetical protein